VMHENEVLWHGTMEGQHIKLFVDVAG